MAVLSVDLAYKSYSDFGIAALDQTSGIIECELFDLPSAGSPSPQRLAEYLNTLCARYSISIILLDGPQGWKATNNGLLNSRCCERALNTPAKTGEPFTVKPAAYCEFVKFSIDTYDALDALGWRRLNKIRSSDRAPHLLIESFPNSAWKELDIKPLPAKRKTTMVQITNCLTELQKLFPLRLPNDVTHDQLQAIVSGLAGLAIERDHWDACRIAGIPPVLEAHYWREGFIVNRLRPLAP
ncbi:MAG: DUF429 domain-containing protein [Anaerolineaceae bacterium]|nr:DUF429 domain-containing protein [Anaerolineaceae bacterium]